MGFFKKLLGISDKVAETAGEVSDVLRKAEALKNSIRLLSGRQLTPAIITDLMGQVDALVAGIDAIRK